MYTMYVNNYDNAVKFLKTVSTRPHFQKFLNDTLMKPEVKHAALETYLIMPIQRIPRYKMLLEEVIKNTEANHPDLDGLGKALDAIKKIATYINDSVKKAKQREKIIEIEQLFNSRVDLVTAARSFVRHGPLVKKCRASDRRYEFFLFNDLLLYASSVLGRLKLQRKININNTFGIQDLPDKPAKNPARDKPERFRFQILSKTKSFIVTAANEAEKRAWFDDLDKCIQGVRNSIRGRGTRAGSQFSANGTAPVWQSDHSSNECQLCNKRFGWINRRHHCRFCGSLVCNSCSLRRLVIKDAKDQAPKRICDRCVREYEAQQASSSTIGSQSLLTGHRKTTSSSSLASDTSTITSYGRSAPLMSKSSPSLRALSSVKSSFPIIPEEASGERSNEDLLAMTQQSNPLVSEPTSQTKAQPAPPTAGGADNADAENAGDAAGFGGTAAGNASDSPPDIVIITYTYTAEEDGELTVVEGEYVTVAEMHENGWWNGTTAKGESGWFPSSFARLLPKLISTYDYKGESEEDLSFNHGDIVYLVKKPTDQEESGWWQGYRDGAVGTFPSNYFEPYTEPIAPAAQNAGQTPSVEPKQGESEAESQLPAAQDTKIIQHDAGAATDSGAAFESQAQDVVKNASDGVKAKRAEAARLAAAHIRTRRRRSTGNLAQAHTHTHTHTHARAHSRIFNIFSGFGEMGVAVHVTRPLSPPNAPTQTTHVAMRPPMRAPRLPAPMRPSRRTHNRIPSPAGCRRAPRRPRRSSALRVPRRSESNGGILNFLYFCSGVRG